MRNCLFTLNKIPNVEAEIIAPVKTVTTVAVRRGRILNSDRRALPTFVPTRSPTVAITPPKIKITAIILFFIIKHLSLR